MLPNNLSKQQATALSAYVEDLHVHFGDQLVDVQLFGSRARDEAKPDSDIDVLVILATEEPNALGYARGLGFDILLTYSVFLSIRVMSVQQWQALAAMESLFYRNLKRDGVSLLPEQV